MFSIFSSHDSKINILDQPFSHDNANHVAFAMQKVGDFTKSRDALLGLDGKIALAIGGDTLLYAIGFFGAFTAAIMLVGIGYIGFAQYNRKELAAEFNNKLNELMDVYHWMLKDKTVELTKVDLFMDVAEAIAPFVSRNELTPWKFSNVSLTSFSDRYIKLLAQPPHNIQLVMNKKQSMLSTLVSSVSATTANIQNEKEPASLEEKVVSKAKAALAMFEQTHAEAKRAFYSPHQVSRMSH